MQNLSGYLEQLPEAIEAILQFDPAKTICLTTPYGESMLSFGDYDLRESTLFFVPREASNLTVIQNTAHEKLGEAIEGVLEQETSTAPSGRPKTWLTVLTISEHPDLFNVESQSDDVLEVALEHAQPAISKLSEDLYSRGWDLTVGDNKQGQSELILIRHRAR